MVIFFVLLCRKLHHTLDELEDQGCHHLNVHGLSIRIVGIEPEGQRVVSIFYVYWAAQEFYILFFFSIMT